MDFLMLNGYWLTALITNPWVRRLENDSPSRAYYENPTQASNDILRAKTSPWSWLQGIELSAKRDIMTMGVPGGRKGLISFLTDFLYTFSKNFLNMLMYELTVT